MWRKTNETKAPGQLGNESSAAPAATPLKPQVNSTPQPSPSASTSAAQPPLSSPAPISQPVAPPSAPVAVAPKPVATSSVVSQAPSSSVIGAGLKIRGEISGNSDLHIEGEAQGQIRLTGGRVSVGPNGNVQADVDAREISIEGALQGNLKASESVRLGPSSKVQGSILAPRIGIEDGARLRGKVEMVRASDSRTASPVAATAEPEKKPAALHATAAAAEGAPSHA
jgi:cytoskeletal protein CcmA (bactofilin family)